MITAESADGVIMIDVNQRIAWANATALTMHGVVSAAELGGTIDEYHANFQVKFRATQQAAPDRTVENVAAGESFRDVVIEVTPLDGASPQWIYRVRNLVLVDESGSPTCIVLVLRQLDRGAEALEPFAAALSASPVPAAIIRLEDRVFLQANEACVTLLDIDRAALAALSVTVGTIAGGSQEACMDQAGSAMLARNGAMGAHAETVSFTAMPIDHKQLRCMLVTFAAGCHAPSRAIAPDDAIALAQSLCAMAPSPLFALNDRMEVLAASPSWLEWLGAGRETVEGRKLSAFMTQASAAHWESHGVQALARDRHVRDLRCEFTAATGATLEALVSISARQGSYDAPAVMIGAVTDITARERNEDAVAAMFALAPVPMVIRKLDDPRILDVNDAFLLATGHTPADAVGHGIEEFGIFESRAARQGFEAAMQGGTVLQNLDARLKTAQGDMLDCVLSARTIYAFGQTCVLMVLQDVSDRRRNEAQLFHAIEKVMEDTSWFSRAVIEKLAVLRSPPRNGARSAEIGDLTPREREVLGFISHGMADADIAQKLGLTRSTVRNHVATLYSKIGVHSRSAAIVWARERGINIAWPVTAAPGLARAAIPAAKPAGLVVAAKARRA